jgi:hypothetical protein
VNNCTYYFDIPWAVWYPHAGSYIYWQVIAEDSDNDHPWDTATSYSPIYTDLALAHSPDVTGDGICNMRDIGALILRFNARPGDPKWNPICDLNGDGKINMRDIAIAILNFNKRF